MVDLGFDSAQSIVVERREIGGRIENRATLQFQGERRGIPGMLGNAGSMSTLEFVSPEAGVVVSLLVKQPRTLVEDLLRPTIEVTRAIAAVARGNLTETVRLEVDGRPLEGEFLRSAAAFFATIAAGIINENVAHDLCSHGKEMSAILPVNPL